MQRLQSRHLQSNSAVRYFSSLCLIGLALLVGCAKEPQQQPNEETATNGTLEVVADESLKPAIDSLVKGFMIENKRAKISVKYETAGQAVEDLLNQKARVVIVGRHLVPIERKVLSDAKLSLPEFDMAEDGIGVAVSATCPLTALSTKDLRAIYRNELTDWSKLTSSASKPTGEIHKVLPAYSSSTEWTLDSMYLDANAVPQGKITRYATTDSLLNAVRRDPHALTFIGSAWKHQLDARGDSTIKVIPLIPEGSEKPVILHPAYIYQKVYPLTTEVDGYTFDSPNTLSRGFLAYAMTAHGQSVFKNFDVLPKTQLIRLVPSR
jgi:phosphate transport system substrate-binding protein